MKVAAAIRGQFFCPMLAMRWVEIKIRMFEHGIYTQKELAQKLGVNPSTVTRLLKGQRKSRRLEKRIAEILELEEQSDEERRKASRKDPRR